jgi:hypothetical protein
VTIHTCEATNTSSNNNGSQIRNMDINNEVREENKREINEEYELLSTNW